MNKNNKLVFFLVFFLGLSLYTVLFHTTKTDAAVPGGTATITLSPGTSSLTPGVKTIQVRTNTGTKSVIGFQFVANLSGTIPADLAFTPTAVSGLQIAYNQVVTTANGKDLKVALSLSDNTVPYTTNGATVTLGTITFTAPATGTLNVSFDNSLSFILENATFNDILLNMTNAVYTFASLASPSPTLVPSPSPSPTIQPSASPGSTTLKVKFEGVTSAGPAKTVRFTIKQGTTTVGTQTVTMNSDANGTYSHVSLPSEMVPAGTYDFFIKGPAHITKKFSSVAVNTNTPVLDFTSQPLVCGDVITTGISNDIVDVADYNQFVTDFGPRFPSGGSNADFNFDNDVDIYDYSFFVTNFNKQGDQ